jgi:ribosome biogenesis GTPase A
LLKEQQRLTHETLVLAKRIGLDTSDQQYGTSFLQHILTPTNDTKSSAQSDREQAQDLKETTFSIVVAGEFNAGKSTLINALLGQKFLETGPLPTTEQITVLTGSSSVASTTRKGDIEDLKARDQRVVTTTDHTNAIVLHHVNSPFLDDITFIDTPGTNALNNHTARTVSMMINARHIIYIN